MPIIDIECVGAAAIDARQLVAALGECLRAPAGTVWLRLRRLDTANYAENGTMPESLPVFVRVLARQADPGALPRQAYAIADAVAQAAQRPRQCVHVIHEPDALGRVFFGGEPDPR